MTCRHNHPFPEHCTECRDEQVAWSIKQDEKARILKIVNRHFEQADMHGKVLLAGLRDELRGCDAI